MSEIVDRTDGSTKDTKFTNLTKGVSAPKANALPIAGLCTSGTSYSYVLHDNLSDEYAFLASTLENQPTSNLGRADYLSRNS